MNAAARLVHQGALSRHFVFVTHLITSSDCSIAVDVGSAICQRSL